MFQVFEPLEQEAERKAVTVWAEAEARTFVEKYLMYPKNFEKIAACLDGKTTRDCVVSCGPAAAAACWPVECSYPDAFVLDFVKALLVASFMCMCSLSAAYLSRVF